MPSSQSRDACEQSALDAVLGRVTLSQCGRAKMPKMEMTIPHHLSQQEAMRRIKGLLEQVKAEYPDAFSDLHESWTDTGGEFSARIKGMDVSGQMVVTPNEVQL